MLIVYLLTALWHLSYLCSAQCYDSNTFCLNSWEYSPSTCSPDLATLLPTIYTNQCLPNDLILWKEGIEDGTSTASDPLIDYNFIICQELFSICGYVPLQTESSSSCGEVIDDTAGVIIGAGVDLGQQTAASLGSLGASVALIDILDDYVGLTGSAAAEAVCNHSFNISISEAYNLSIALMDKYANETREWYNNQRNNNTVPFNQLPLGIRTVLTSIRHRWGNYSNYPTFWAYVLSNDFVNATNELRSWYDNCATDIRLSTEANVLQVSLGCTTSSGVDCVFLIDESGSVGSTNFGEAKDWIIEFVEEFESSIRSDPDSGARFGVATFASGYTNEFYLNSYSDIDDYRNRINAVSYSGGGTYLGNALRLVGTNQFVEARGMRASSKGIPRVLIVMTDGQSSDNVATGVASLSGLNLNIIAVGIAGYNLNQLREITTDEYIYTLDTFTDLDDIIGDITIQTCYVPSQLDIDSSNAVTNITINNGEPQYFQFSTSSVNPGENIVLNITQNTGCVYVYVSYCVQYPSYYVNVVEFTSCGQSFKQIILNSQSNSECNSSAVIYVAFEGRGVECGDDDVGSSLDFEIGSCNKTKVGCEEGTNYDPELDDGAPYDINEAADEVTTSSPSSNPTSNPTDDSYESNESGSDSNESADELRINAEKENMNYLQKSGDDKDKNVEIEIELNPSIQATLDLMVFCVMMTIFCWVFAVKSNQNDL